MAAQQPKNPVRALYQSIAREEDKQQRAFKKLMRELTAFARVYLRTEERIAAMQREVKPARKKHAAATKQFWAKRRAERKAQRDRKKSRGAARGGQVRAG